MAETSDFIELLSSLVDELKAYKLNPTPEKEKELRAWVEDVMVAQEVSEWLRISLSDDKTRLKGRKWALPSTTVADRDFLSAAEQEAEDRESFATLDAEEAPIAGYDKWERLIEDLRNKSYSYDFTGPLSATNLYFLQRKVIDPRYYELSFPLEGKGAYITLTAEDMKQVEAKLVSAVLGAGVSTLPHRYIDQGLAEVAEAVGIKLYLYTPEARAELINAPLFAQAAQTPAYQRLISRMLHAAYRYAPEIYNLLRIVIITYLNDDAELAAAIPDVYTEWFKE
ncbi:Hypothetical protein POVN_LOCUS717 [uncultured virus]|nr:Hypothetical protein POVN_LOCUS717 [uncultured virus]